jgi:hypothetical protein
MNTRIRTTQISSGDDLIAGYRTIADTVPPLAHDAPTPEMDSAILSAACENSRRRRARPMGYAAIAAGVVAVVAIGLAPYVRLDPGAMASGASDPVTSGATMSLASNPELSRLQRAPQRWSRVEARSNGNSLNSLVLSTFPSANSELHAASEVPASEIKTAGAVTSIAAQFGTIDLNQPEVLERLARENPFHFAMIRRILAGVDTMPEHAVGRWMKAQFSATDVTYSPVLLTSDPPKKQLTFTLETTRYSALLALTPDGARLVASGPERRGK